LKRLKLRAEAGTSHKNATSTQVAQAQSTNDSWRSAKTKWLPPRRGPSRRIR